MKIAQVCPHGSSQDAEGEGQTQSTRGYSKGMLSVLRGPKGASGQQSPDVRLPCVQPRAGCPLVAGRLYIFNKMAACGPFICAICVLAVRYPCLTQSLITTVLCQRRCGEARRWARESTH